MTAPAADPPLTPASGPSSPALPAAPAEAGGGLGEAGEALPKVVVYASPAPARENVEIAEDAPPVRGPMVAAGAGSGEIALAPVAGALPTLAAAPLGLAPAIPGVLPGELPSPAVAFTAGGKGTKKAREPRKPFWQRVKLRVARLRQPKPALAWAPLWPMPAEVKGRGWMAIVLLLTVLGLYSYMLSCFYAGAHGGVDQAGYLMTARLLSGDYDIDTPKSPARPETVKLADPPSGPYAIWGGGASGYTTAEGDHPAPAAIQISPKWDWLRNRLSFVPESPFQFASRMCIMTEPFGPGTPDLPGSAALPPNAFRAGTPAVPAKPPVAGKPAEYRMFAKYPFGFSLLAAVGRDVAGLFDHTKVYTHEVKSGAEAGSAAGTGVKKTQIVKADAVGKGLDGMYIVNPLCTVLACFFAYFMFRQAVSPFVALIGVLWLACNPMVLNYSNDANSHASTLCAVCIGFWGVISFLRTQQMWRAWIGGFALGYACTIRYSEFLLVLPVIFAAAIHFRPTWRRAMGSVSLLAAWAIPVAALAFVCWVSFGSPTKTGYTYCNEDTGFGWGYLSGFWGGGHTAEGNWETLVLSVNRLGLFIMWPLAIAGLFGMLGATWRLGGVLGLWVLPSMVLYMLYYWAPNTETNTGYLRFFASIMPGMIFAGVWMLERALATIKGEKWAGLTIGTLVGVFLLLVIAFAADGGPSVLEGGLGKTIAGFAKQAPGAVVHLMTRSRLGAFWGVGIITAIVCMWLFDRTIVASRMGIALGAGAITALGCAVNLYSILPVIETSHIRWSTLRVTVDNMREVLPRGSVVFCDDNLLNQLDCVGGWKLYSQNLFVPGTWMQSRNQVDQRSSVETADNPNPLQTERAHFYMELLSQPSSTSSTVSLGGRQDFPQLQKAVIDRNVSEGHRITFLVLESTGDMQASGGPGGGGGRGGSGQITRPAIEGYQYVQLRRWTVSPEPTDAAPPAVSAVSPMPVAPVAPAGRGARGGRGGGRGRGAGGGGPAGGGSIMPIEPVTFAAPTVAPAGATYVLWELVKRN